MGCYAIFSMLCHRPWNVSCDSGGESFSLYSQKCSIATSNVVDNWYCIDFDYCLYFSWFNRKMENKNLNNWRQYLTVVFDRLTMHNQIHIGRYGFPVHIIHDCELSTTKQPNRNTVGNNNNKHTQVQWWPVMTSSVQISYFNHNTNTKPSVCSLSSQMRENLDWKFQNHIVNIALPSPFVGFI